ncbi:MAG: PqqD family protein, partial [Ignavibacteriales bacterium CG_4_9_14_3_um_filter_34_10]
MGHSERKKTLKDANYLDLKPIKMVEFSVTDNIVTLLIPKFENKFLV